MRKLNKISINTIPIVVKVNKVKQNRWYRSFEKKKR